MLTFYLQSDYHKLIRNTLSSLILLVNIIFSQRVVSNLPINEIDLNVVTHVIHVELELRILMILK